MGNIRTRAVHYTSRELSYIRMHQIKKGQRRRKIRQEIRMFIGMMIFCSLIIFGIDGARNLYWHIQERSREIIETGSSREGSSQTASVLSFSYGFHESPGSTGGGAEFT